MRALTAEEMRACDRVAIEEFGVPGVSLMETAGRAVAERALELLEESGGDGALIVCGSGNNGGDGFVAARYLFRAGVDVQVLCTRTAEELRGDARTFHDVAVKMEIPVDYCADTESLPPLAIGPGDVVVDALFGTGLARPVEGLPLRLIQVMRELHEGGVKVVAVDLPSGLHSDTGQILGEAVRADATVTFGYLKRGLLQYPGVQLAGEWEVVDIGLPPQVEEQLGPECVLLDEAMVRATLPRPARDTNKGRLGHVLVVAGSADKPGAAALACLGALRAGAGLVTLATRAGGHAATVAAAPEVMGLTLPGEGPLGPDDLPALQDALAGKDALLIGPGIPRAEPTRTLLKRLLSGLQVPAVIDADALNAIGDERAVFAGLEQEVVLTPHPGEMARLLPSTTAKVQADRYGSAGALAAETGATVVLKGAATVVAEPDGRLAVNPTGNPGLATGGSGDVLAGIIAALLGRGLPAAEAARAGVFVHGLAADRKAEQRGATGLSAGDLPLALTELWATWSL
ncbi:MAG: NAD(P)H-hydrate dehydratase [Deltaproteobacteria bacterium]|nr:NAD(P)H-hydrate dehydratase [Deltaproteobacteria bacterium]